MTEGESMLQLGERQKQLLEDLENFWFDRIVTVAGLTGRDAALLRIAAALGLEEEFRQRIQGVKP